MSIKQVKILWHYLRCRFRPQFKSKSQLSQWQTRQWRRMKQRVLSQSPYYREWQDQPLAAFPIMNKSTHMAHLADINTASVDPDQAMALAIQAEQDRDFSPTLNGVTVGLSSGTSGGRGLFLVSEHEQVLWSARMLAKVLPKPIWHKQKIAFFLRANSNLYESVKSKRIQFRFFDLLDDMDQHIEQLNQWQADVLVAPASTLRRLAQAMSRRLNIKPNKVISVAEVLSPEDEAFIGQAFKQTIHQVYQATEGFLAHTCEHGHLHLNEDLILVEKDWIDRKTGRYCPIITDLQRQSQPIVRYRLDDVLIDEPEPCPCGSVMQRIRAIEGRCDDLLLLPNKHGNAQWLYPDFIRNALIGQSAELQSYQVDQTHTDRIRVGLEPLNANTMSAASHAFSQLCQRLGLLIPSIQFVAYQAPEPGAKLRRVRRLFVPTRNNGAPS